MNAFIDSTLLVLVAEIGDKTQLLSLLLIAKFRKPIPILLGIFTATLINHAVSAHLGRYISIRIDPHILTETIAILFVLIGFWVLIPDKVPEHKETKSQNAFIAALVLFFIAEMGDKTQLATMVLGAKYSNLIAVTLGTTLGMMLANAPVVMCGERIMKKIKFDLVRKIASAMFIAYGIYSYIAANMEPGRGQEFSNLLHFFKF